MSNVSLANYGNYYTANTAKNSFTVKTFNGAVMQPTTTVRYKDVYTPSIIKGIVNVV